MKNIPLHADVECTDGLCGQSTAVIIDPETHRVTHFVVKEKTRFKTERLVRIERVAETTPDLIRVDCTDKELSDMTSFTVTEFRQVEMPSYVGAGYAEPLYISQVQTLPVEEDRVPEGKVAIRQGADVQASDGRVGQVDDLVADSKTGDITHLILRSGHPWGKIDVAIPLSMVKSIEINTVYLKADKETIASMLAVPARQGQDITDIVLMVYSLDEINTAGDALKALKPLADQDANAVLNAAMLVKDADGKTSLKELVDVGAGHGALFGAITGGVIGLVGGPIGVVVGAAAGVATGGIAARKIDMGFPDEYLQKLQDHLRPDSSAIVALVKKEGIDKVTSALSTFKGQLLQQEVTEDLAGKLTERVAFERDTSND